MLDLLAPAGDRRPLPPAEVSKPVADKILQVHTYINTHLDVQLNRDPNSNENQDLITFFELDLNAILSIMYWHYERGTQPGLLYRMSKTPSSTTPSISSAQTTQGKTISPFQHLR